MSVTQKEIIINEEEQKFLALKAYLQKEIQQHQSSARLKSFLAHLLFWIVIAASALGLMNTSTDWLSKEALSGIAVIPGIALVITNTFKYEARSKWHKLKQRKLEGLCMRLMFEDASVNDISKEVTVVLEELDKIKIELERPINSK